MIFYLSCFLVLTILPLIERWTNINNNSVHSHYHNFGFFSSTKPFSSFPVSLHFLSFSQKFRILVLHKVMYSCVMDLMVFLSINVLFFSILDFGYVCFCKTKWLEKKNKCYEIWILDFFFFSILLEELWF